MGNTDENYNLYSEVRSVKVEWLWYPYIPCGKIVLLQGDPGCGKSTMMMDVIGSLTTGRILPDGRELPPINVIYQCSEDGLADTIKPRLEKAQADCKHIGYISEDLFGLTLDDEKIRNAIIAMNAKLLVIDPFQAYIGDTDLSSATGMRRILRRLSMWAASTNCAVVLVGHLNKKNGTKELYRGLGSIDLIASARSVIQVEKTENDESVRLVRHIKSSLSPKGADSYFSIDCFGKVKWLPKSAAKIKLSEKETEDAQQLTKQETAGNMLRELLCNGPAEAMSVEAEIMQYGVSQRTILLAKKTMAIVSKRKNGKWYWQLPTWSEENGEEV